MRRLRFALVAAALAALTGGAAYTAAAPTGAPSQDGNVEWTGLGHDSRAAAYRSPGGAVRKGTKVRLRFRTYHDDVTGVTVRVWYTATSSERLVDMARVASNVPCYQQLAHDCDFWEATLDAGDPGTVYYRFIVADGTKSVYYEDDSDVRDGGWGKPFDSSPDWGWAITVYDPAFKPVPWLENGVIYQIFPDRFRNANPKNDPVKGKPRKYVWSKDKRYAYPHGDKQHESTPALDRIVRMPWRALPEGYCRNYADALKTCRKRFPPQKSQGTEGPHGRDYYGGDLAGVTEKLGYLKKLGVTVVYFNPIFWAGSNHRYDTRDYRKIDPYLGKTKTFKKLVKKAHKLGLKVVLDGVFNHMSSDSPFFDRYHNWKGTGACEAVYSDYRGFFNFRVPATGEPKPCAGGREHKSYYDSWFGFDSLPKLTEVQGVKDYVFPVARKWLKLGADGWRLDVMQEKSIPFWHEFRSVVKRAKPGAAIIGELWKKFDVLPYVQGDTADSSMNYRFRDAVIGLLAPHPFDSKGFPGSGQPLKPSEFVSRMESIREDYPDAVYSTLMNLVDSHDTERALWTLTPGAETRGAREQNAANLAEGKRRLQLAAVLQMFMPGAPTIYYGDEVGLSGDDDPDDRRTYPWGDKAARKVGDRRKPDKSLLGQYRELIKWRKDFLPQGDARFLLANDQAKALAYGIKDGQRAMTVILNLSKQRQVIHVPVAGFLPGQNEISQSVDGLAAAWRLDSGDLTPPAAPTGLTAQADDLAVQLSWNAVAGASTYRIYRSPLSGGGYTVLSAEVTSNGGRFYVRDATPSLRSGVRYFYVIKALDATGNESSGSNEASAVPSYPIDAVTLDRPATLDYTVSAVDTTVPVFGRILINGVTGQGGQAQGVLAQVGYGAPGTNPAGWTWVGMTYSADASGQDEYTGTLQPFTPGAYSYRVRFSTSQGTTWKYGGLPGTNAAGMLTVHPNPDQTAPAAPTGLTAKSRGSTAIGLAWNAVSASDLYQYVVYRSTTAGSGYQEAGRVDKDTRKFTDTGLTTGTRYYYVVKARDEANNYSAASSERSAIPSALQVDVTFVVTPPGNTPAAKELYVAGNRPELCEWCNPHTKKLTKGGDGKWRITISFSEGTQLEYKYTLGSWDFVEKGGQCDEIANRKATVAPEGDSDAMTVEDTVKNWRNVAPCGS